MAEFGTRCGNFQPSLSCFKKHFPDAIFTLYSDSDKTSSEFNLKKVISPFNKGHPRYGYRSNDYYKIIGLLESKAEIAIAIDDDMLIVSNSVSKIIPLTKKFGMCLPCNPRYLVAKDTMIGEDSDKILDESGGTSFALNMSPISRKLDCKHTEKIMKSYCEEIIKKPVRGPLAMWRSIWKEGHFPCILPPQWCVCREHCGVGGEIILHLGHEEVKKYYRIK